jgi:hypothetical protein
VGADRQFSMEGILKMSDPFDSTEKLAAATIVAGLVSGTNP